MFDPETVERLRCSIARSRGGQIEVVPLVVDASDYDQLLALNRELISQIRVLIKERDGLLPSAAPLETATS